MQAEYRPVNYFIMVHMNIQRLIINNLFAALCIFALLTGCSSLITGDLDRDHYPVQSVPSGAGEIDYQWGQPAVYPQTVVNEEQEGRLQGDVEPEPESIILN